MQQERKKKGRPKKYTEIESYLLDRCHVKIVQDILKQCVFSSDYPSLKILMKIYKLRLARETDSKQRQIYRTLIKYIWIYIEQTDFITQYQQSQEKYGYEAHDKDSEMTNDEDKKDGDGDDVRNHDDHDGENDYYGEN